jgi:histidinol-phosphatase
MNPRKKLGNGGTEHVRFVGMQATIEHVVSQLELPSDLATRFALAVEAVLSAREITLGYFQGSRFTVDEKADGTVVTTADRETETHLRRLINSEFPDDGLVGEEYGEEAGRGAYRWILDPIDGTKSFACGVPLFGTLVALQREGVIEIGLMSLPAIDELVWAIREMGTWHVRGHEPAQQARVSHVDDLARATVCTTSYDYFRDAGLGPAHEALCRGVGSTRGWSDCYAQLLLATGRIDAVVEPLVYPWDVAAVQVIIQEAGGRYSDWTGEPTIESRTSISSNGQVHADLVKLMSSA